ncbi:MAG: hypothetical protein LBC74_05780 [Planctomycetaceae bacterium]|nr:hypothetical protein [Planctomycetaceae bacterium]
MDDFYSSETELNTGIKNSAENNIPHGIIIARMPDLGDCKPIPNGTSDKDRYANNNRCTNNNSTQQVGLFEFLRNFISRIFRLNSTLASNYTGDHSISSYYTQFAKSNVNFSRLIIVGIIVLFCGIGLIVQNQINKNNNSKDIDDQIIVTKNNYDTIANTGNTTDNNSNNNLSHQTLKNTTLNNAVSDNAVASNINTQKNNQSDTNSNPKNKPNFNTDKPDSQSANTTTKPNQTTTTSIWDRSITDNYSPWMKNGQISLDNNPESENNPNINTRTSENHNNVITQTSTAKIQPPKISTPYPSGTNPNQQSNTTLATSQPRGSYYYGMNNNSNSSRATPPPYANSMSIPMSNPNIFHAPPVSHAGASQGRIAVVETPDTYRNFYGNRTDLRTSSSVTRPPTYTYPTQPAGAIAPVQPPLTASNYQLTNHYPNPAYHQPAPTYQSTPIYPTSTHNPNAAYPNNTYKTYPTTSYPNTVYPAATYSGGGYPNGTYPNGTYPNGTYPNPNLPYAVSR